MRISNERLLELLREAQLEVFGDVNPALFEDEEIAEYWNSAAETIAFLLDELVERVEGEE